MTMKVELSFDVIWYSSSAYQILPKPELPVPHFCSVKSSLKFEPDPFVFVFAVLVLTLVFVFVFVTLLFRFTLRLFELLVFVLLMLASAITMTTSPIPITANAASPPSIHQIAFDFFLGATVGVGDHCGGG